MRASSFITAAAAVLASPALGQSATASSTSSSAVAGATAAPASTTGTQSITATLGSTANVVVQACVATADPAVCENISAGQTLPLNSVIQWSVSNNVLAYSNAQDLTFFAVSAAVSLVSTPNAYYSWGTGTDSAGLAAFAANNTSAAFIPFATFNGTAFSTSNHLNSQYATNGTTIPLKVVWQLRLLANGTSESQYIKATDGSLATTFTLDPTAAPLAGTSANGTVVLPPAAKTAPGPGASTTTGSSGTATNSKSAAGGTKAGNVVAVVAGATAFAVALFLV
ncbi:hypothetical protein HKX48_009392 [Thoreauomyces humboldtii]|nr:hypothetical protein HKX48_009392 [Thoreauomyces humboldtii]